MAKNPHEKTVRADDKAVLCFELEYKSSKLHDKVDWESGQSTLADILVRFCDSDYPEEKKKLEKEDKFHSAHNPWSIQEHHQLLSSIVSC